MVSGVIHAVPDGSRARHADLPKIDGIPFEGAAARGKKGLALQASPTPKACLVPYGLLPELSILSGKEDAGGNALPG
jgi:hypothetical protein